MIDYTHTNTIYGGVAMNPSVITALDQNDRCKFIYDGSLLSGLDRAQHVLIKGGPFIDDVAVAGEYRDDEAIAFVQGMIESAAERARAIVAASDAEEVQRNNGLWGRLVGRVAL